MLFSWYVATFDSYNKLETSKNLADFARM
jgi:hypothetical protein